MPRFEPKAGRSCSRQVPHVIYSPSLQRPAQIGFQCERRVLASSDAAVGVNAACADCERQFEVGLGFPSLIRMLTDVDLSAERLGARTVRRCAWSS